MRKVYLPENLAQLWRLYGEDKNRALYAGGTDLLVQMRAGRIDPPALICLERLAEISKIEISADEIAIGAAVTHSQLLENPIIKEELPVLCQALQTLGSPHIRNMGTIGGNIMTASPAADTLPPLYLLKAEIELVSRTGCRHLPLKNFITAPGRTDINREEILSRIKIPREPLFTLHFFEKVGLRQSLSIAVVSMAALINLTPENRITDIRLAWGSIGPTIVTLPQIRDFFLAKKLNRELLKEASIKVQQLVEPISDVRAGADYRRRVAGQLLLRLEKLIDVDR